MNDQERIDNFLQIVQNDWGDKVLKKCRELIAELSPSEKFDEFSILTRAKYILQEPALQELAAMNQQPFDCS